MQPQLSTPNAGATAPSVLEKLINRDQLAADFGCSHRTVIRRERAGMPFIRLGMMRLYSPDAVRAWLMSHEHRHDIPKRGRPTKQAA